MRFSLYPLRLTFRARRTFEVSPNVVRGALGTLLPASDRETIFSPREAGPSGLADPPRPFVVRIAAGIVEADQSFSVEFPYFDTRRSIGAITRAFSRWNRAELTGVTGDSILSLPLHAPPESVHSVTVQFLTPTELKVDGGLAPRPEFEVLTSRIRDRISTLRALYGDGPLEIDYRAFAERASRIRMTRCDIRHVQDHRRSTRTGQTHPLGGFTGEADYEGDLAEFLPYLEVAYWTGVGRQTVWGKGILSVTAARERR